MWLLTPQSPYFAMMNLSQFMRVNAIPTESSLNLWELRAYITERDNDEDPGVFIQRGTSVQMHKLMVAIGAGKMISPKFAPTTTTFH